MLFHRELEANLYVCANCGHHLRIAAEKRLGMMFDDGRYTQIELPKTIADPIKFRDRKRYSDRLKRRRPRRSRAATRRWRMAPSAVLPRDLRLRFCLHGRLDGRRGREAVLTAARLAVLQEAALIMIPSSGGARMQEGILALMQLPRTTLAVEMVKEAHRPTSSSDRSDDGRRLRLLRHAGRRDAGRARRWWDYAGAG